MARDTTTGRVFEQMVLPALNHSPYLYKTQVCLGRKPSGSKHIADLVIYEGDRRLIVSKKWQQSQGTAEEKIPFEVIMLVRACREWGYTKAYLVLGGTDHDPEQGTQGWTLRQWYLSGGLKTWIPSYQPWVELLTLEAFVAKINRHQL
jgi:hypothetical protein